MTATNLNGQIRVLIVDDHEVFRHGLEQALASEPDIDVVGSAIDGLAAAEQAVALTPDVVLMDLRMPVLTGVEATARIRTPRPDVKIVMLTVVRTTSRTFSRPRAAA